MTSSHCDKSDNVPATDLVTQGSQSEKLQQEEEVPVVLTNDKGKGEEFSSLKDKFTDRKLRDLSDSEVHQFPGIKRDHWWQLWRPLHAPSPPKLSLDDAEVIPLSYASIFSKLTFQWVTPIMIKGYQRPLQATDLWKMDPSREALDKRQQDARKWNEALPTAHPTTRQKVSWRTRALFHYSLPNDLSSFGEADSYAHRLHALEVEWRNRSGKKRGSVSWALNDVMTGFWAGGAYKVAGDVSQLMVPLLIKALINFSKEDSPEPNIGRGVGMAVGLFLLTVMQSVCQHQFFFRSMAIGVLARATLISAIYKKAMCLSVGGRAQHPNGKLLTYLSSDISRVDYCAQWFHAVSSDEYYKTTKLKAKTSPLQVWTAPIQLTITLSEARSFFKSVHRLLTYSQIGPSALVGFSLFVILAPLQTWFMKLSFKVRKKSMKWTDSRSRLLRELLASMEIIKVFTYEIPFLKPFSVPALASVLAFVTYASTHDGLDPALIFTSLAFFNLLRQPLMFLPRALSSLTDAQNAIERLTDVAVRVDNATFSWSQGTSPSGKGGPDDASFKIQNLEMVIPRGKIIGVVGPVGSGKSSLLQGLIGEMSILSGSITFGGRLSYCQQNAWIQNATLRDNILFGQPWEEDRYWRAVQDANLIPDLEILADGDLTEIGEKGACRMRLTSTNTSCSGINLSGGQKQRVNIARALYYNADIVLFDDPLSAVDAHVGKALFEHAILPLSGRGRTVILVTHAVHFLPMVDRIYVMSGGQIVEQGTYEDLMRASGPAARLFTEFGGSHNELEQDDGDENAPNVEAVVRRDENSPHSADVLRLTSKNMGKAVGTGKLEGRLMVSEVRKTGSVGGKAIMQGSQVMATVWLTWWQETRFNKSWDLYQGVYAVLGISQAIFTFAMGASLGIMANLASQNLHSSALENVFYSPKSVFDTQPLGRILGVFGKDIDTIDNQLADSLRMMALTLVTLIGSVAIITVYLHYFIAVIFIVGIGYWEVKRLDSMLRSLLYSHFSESLSGLATIRAYGETERFIHENAYYMDLENRAYLLSATNQRWLSIRLDFLGACLVFAVAVMSAKGGGGLTASEIALCLTYLTSITQVTRQSAEVENNMNAVERVLWYSDAASLPQEAAHDIPATKPSDTWPESGSIVFKDVVMSYRPGLPAVLKGLSMSIHGGEKVGIIGRTGAGKTSITMALFRLVELNDALARSCVTSNQDIGDIKRLTLDTNIEEEGQNLSVGERSLVSLARALVKDSNIVVLDEATAAVDLETDSRIQQTIHREFKGKTLLCIAHRLRTIISWDRILVMNAGQIEVS
ncbi:uncharacterized protein IL334_002327 [Kwoniella shivajii]|uniref:ATP-binding cassette transporter YOR1 n=1 Tax=Kwoniella shivajii TaxID=564305 RepID=A0ABZ1CVR6_9TREE|nr:hypothetical protein IL334_002327 [Kwoniella shivajii]